MPRVSVIIPSYNHGKYVAECLESVLEQSFTDFEIVITDDGSTDDTVDIIKGFTDPRIRLFEFKENMGAPFAVRNCVYESKGEFLAMLSSDDVFMPGKLERQVKFLDEHPDVWAVFGYAKVIDENGADFDDPDHFYTSIFHQPNRTRHEWLRHLFFKGNCLCHPSVLARREVYTDLGFPDPRYAQLGDYYRWVRTCLAHEIHIIPEELIKFRVRAGEANASGQRPIVAKRAYFEFYHIYRHYLEIDTTEDLLKVFPEAEKYGTVVPELIPYFIARVAIDSGEIFPVHQMFGLNILFDMMGDEKTIAMLDEKCGFKHRDFIKLTGAHDCFNLGNEQLLAQLNAKQKEVEAIRGSMSWKVTEPLRWVFRPRK